MKGLEMFLAEGLEKVLKETGLVEEDEGERAAFGLLVGYVNRTALGVPAEHGADHGYRQLFGSVGSSSATNSGALPLASSDLSDTNWFNLD